MASWSRLKILAASVSIFGSATMNAVSLTQEDLEIIQSYVDSNNAQALYEFLVQNPDLIDSSPLGQSLRMFVEEVEENPGVLSRRTAFGEIRRSVVSAAQDPSQLVPAY